MIGIWLRAALVTTSIVFSVLNWWVPGLRSYALYGNLPYLPELKVVDGKLSKIDGHTPTPEPTSLPSSKDSQMSPEGGPLPAGGGL